MTVLFVYRVKIRSSLSLQMSQHLTVLGHQQGQGWLYSSTCFLSVQRRHNEHDGVSHHQHHDCLLNRLSKRRSSNASKLCVTGLWSVNSQHKGPVTRKIFPFDDVIMWSFVSRRWLRIILINQMTSFKMADNKSLDTPSVKPYEARICHYCGRWWLSIWLIMISYSHKFIQFRC